MPIIGHIHGTELLMLERHRVRAPAELPHAEVWVERLRRWAADCERLIVGDAKGAERAALLLDLPLERFAVIPNGFDPVLQADRAGHRTGEARGGGEPCGVALRGRGPAR